MICSLWPHDFERSLAGQDSATPAAPRMEHGSGQGSTYLRAVAEMLASDGRHSMDRRQRRRRLEHDRKGSPTNPSPSVPSLCLAETRNQPKTPIDDHQLTGR